MKIRKLENKFALANRYPGQTNQQDCYISLDLSNETLTAESNPEIGNAVPMSNYHGHERRYSIPCLTAAAANDLLDEIAPLAERVIAGYESAWNGSNHVARLSEDAQAAEAEIDKICEQVSDSTDESTGVTMMSADDVPNCYDGITADTTDEELAAEAEKFEENMADEFNTEITDALEVFTARRQYLRDQRED